VASIDRYIVERNDTQVRTAFAGIVKLVKEKGITRVTLIVPKKGGWEHSIVGEFLGARVAKALAKGQSVTLVEGVTMLLESPQTFRPTAGQGLLVGVHISIKEMAKLDDAWGAQAILFLPWSDIESQEWKATWHPETFGQKGPDAPANALSQPVQEALGRLTESINLGTGLTHPLDKKHAEQTFDKLRSDGCSFDPVEVRRWAQRNNWSSKAAADLEEVARRRAS
jgi:hypothetical protein